MPNNKLRVLVAEDDDVNSKVIQYYLDRAGYAAIHVTTGVQVLMRLQDESFDCILMDSQMPELGGIETAQRIRAGDSGKNSTDIPIIALTAHAMVGDKERFLEAGMNDYLAKPIDMEELQHVLARVVGK